MNIHKKIKYIKRLISRKLSFFYRPKRNTIKSKKSLNIINTPRFVKKRKSFTIKNKQLEKLKIFWNNISHYYILICTILLSISIYIVFWPVFKIKNIEIIKQDDITNMIISYKSVENYRWQSIFNAEKKNIEKLMKNYQHNINNIQTNIILPNTLRIVVNSYKWLFNTTINNKKFIITTNWTLIPSSYSKELDELVIKDIFNKNKFLDYKKNIDEKYLSIIFNIKEAITKNIVDLKIKELKYYSTERELHITTWKNTIIIFNLNWNIKEQIEKIVIFHKEQLDINNGTIVYIDLRIKGKIFYCLTEEEFQCKQNLKDIYK